MQKKLAIPLVLIISFILLACSISYEGINFTDDEQLNRLSTGTALQELLNEFTAEAPSSGIGGPLPVTEPTSVPQPTAVAEPIPVPVTNTATEFSVTAQNFDCICEASGTVTQEYKVEGDQLQIGGMVFEKIGTNSYRRSWMGYYILVSGEGDNQTETQVEESRSSVITLTENGYIMENFQGDSGSPCCINTFTKNK
ncbi:MAG: hypothetical protein GX768_01975 [Chloroflexi bacterium]|nr:hypothetical protein [Chloroflexota bacterium]